MPSRKSTLSDPPVPFAPQSSDPSSVTQSLPPPPGMETPDHSSTDFKGQYKAIGMVCKQYKTLLSRLQTLDVCHLSVLNDLVKILCSFEALGEHELCAGEREQTVKAMKVRVVCESLLSDVVPKLCTGEHAAAAVELNVELGKLPEVKAAYKSVSRLQLDVDHYEKKVEAVSIEAEKTMGELQVDPNNAKLSKANEMAQERKIRNHEKLESCSRELQSAVDAFGEMARSFEENRVKFSTVGLELFLLNLGGFWRKLERGFSTLDGYQYDINGTSRGNDRVIPEAIAEHKRRSSSGVTKFAKGLSKRSSEIGQSLSHMKKHLGSKKEGGGPASVKSTGVEGCREERSGTVNEDSIFLEKLKQFKLLKKDIDYICQTLTNFLPHLLHLLDAQMNVAQSFSDISDFYGDDTSQNIVSSPAKMLEGVNAMKEHFGIFSGNVAHSRNTFATRIEDLVVIPLKEFGPTFISCEKKAVARGALLLDYQHYSTKVDALKRAVESNKMDADADPGNQKIINKGVELKGKLEGNLGKLEAARSSLAARTSEVGNIFEEMENSVRVNTIENLFKVVLELVMGQWKCHADNILGVHQDKLENILGEDGLGDVNTGDSEGGREPTQIARVRGPSAPPPAAAPPVPVESGNGNENENDEIMSTVNLDDLPIKSIVFSPPPKVGEMARKASDARKSLDGNSSRPTSQDLKSFVVPEAKTRSLSERSKSIGSVNYDINGSEGSGRDSIASSSGRSAGIGSISEDRPSYSHMDLQPKTKYGDDITDMMRTAQLNNEKEVEQELEEMDHDRRESERLAKENRVGTELVSSRNNDFKI